LLEREWKQAKTNAMQKTIAEMGAIFIAGTYTGVRGEELMLVDLVVTKKRKLGRKRGREFLAKDSWPDKRKSFVRRGVQRAVCRRNRGYGSMTRKMDMSLGKGVGSSRISEWTVVAPEFNASNAHGV
jgi:hypothetical protein